MKKNSLVFLVSAILLLSACLKKQEPIAEPDPLIQFAKDTLIIKKYLADSIPAKRLDQTGVYYQIIKPGTGTVKPEAKSEIKIKVNGRLLSGKVFTNPKDTLKNILGNQISGVQFGLPLIRKGGRIRLILASYYAFGPLGNYGQTVPPNAVVDLDINLIDIK
ncbi:MAG: hypothetical protein EAZ51_06735 [Sphingobacteriales bacterium]|nr:MAG: hypothetical protein EAZ64_09205 [Sphingobacteriales bacterium]TAF80042.1 MAG: hypothetical protein EAZ51_06735 [Sphingobacteriales bacterium]